MSAARSYVNSYASMKQNSYAEITDGVATLSIDGLMLTISTDSFSGSIRYL